MVTWEGASDNSQVWGWQCWLIPLKAHEKWSFPHLIYWLHELSPDDFTGSVVIYFAAPLHTQLCIDLEYCVVVLGGISSSWVCERAGRSQSSHRYFPMARLSRGVGASWEPPPSCKGWGWWWGVETMSMMMMKCTHDACFSRPNVGHIWSFLQLPLKWDRTCRSDITTCDSQGEKN